MLDLFMLRFVSGRVELKLSCNAHKQMPFNIVSSLIRNIDVSKCEVGHFL